ncbi:zinc-binding dehydrogenase [Actinosynnema sp. CS-041913]|uniref:zinc-binding dehydrogenase n=1 Tax=Actinosynnema sp. CS-041913 TaxID=3239917 RepID=UPI003D8DF74E
MSAALRVARPGELDSLELVARPRRGPGPGEVAIRVEAAGVNFKDVLVALGMSGESHDLGLDGAGVVTESAADGLRPGDRVAFFHEGAFADHVTVPADLVMPVPDGMSTIEAATVPVAFLTAWHGLVRLAWLRPGEVVLVHSAAGGVGLAALDVAHLCGAEVLATAGTAAKRGYLHGLGVAEVMDSRTPDFGRQAEGRVDVVLNSLPGPALRAGLDTLREGGRFVEIGKHDIHGGGSIPLAPFRRNLSLHSVDLLLMSRVRRPLVGDLFRELVPLFAEKQLAPLPHVVHDVEDAPAAFRALTTGRHIGKVVLAFPG